MKFLKLFLFFSAIIFTTPVFAQHLVSGTVTDLENEAPIPGVLVSLKGSETSVMTDAEGRYSIEVPAAGGTLQFLYPGMNLVEIKTEGRILINVSLIPGTTDLDEIYIFADRAKEEQTPVAFSNVNKEKIESQLASEDIPLIMNTTPSVYATAQGGGGGDARINVRGFKQKNVAIMVNGVPVNDMESGWLYWSNWEGIGDVTSSIQMQRGLSAVNLASPSIGGTMNIITDPAQKKAGGSVKVEYGSGHFLKTSLTGHSGMINDKFALSLSWVGKVSNGIIDKTWTQSMAYYLGMTYKLNKKHKFDLFVMGAPQRHGQNIYKQNIATYGSDIAEQIYNYDPEAIPAFPEAEASEQYPGYDDVKGGRYYNQNWGPVSPEYSGKQWWNGKKHNRIARNFINEWENYYHKPISNLNWYATWSNKIKQYTTVYYSGGKGGGAKPQGYLIKASKNGIPTPGNHIDWDATIANNTRTDTAFGILRNSTNNQWTVGAISRLKVDILPSLKAQVGIDWRTVEIQHFKEVRDLLGGKFFVDKTNEFETDPSSHEKKLGDKIIENNTNTVDWFGYFAQAEYNTRLITAYATYGQSFIKYTHKNHFKKDPENPNNQLEMRTAFLPGFQLKGGLRIRPLKGLSVFANYGYVSKTPIFNDVIDDRKGTIRKQPKNEIFNAFEAGVNYQTFEDKLSVKINYYHTRWKNRFVSRYDRRTDVYLLMNNVAQKHTGIETEINCKPFPFLELGAVASFNNWRYTDDAKGVFFEDYNAKQGVSADFYIKDLKVGDAPQHQVVGSIALMPLKGLRIQLDGRYYNRHYADFSPNARSSKKDRGVQGWKTPEYFIMDLHASYDFRTKQHFGLQFFLNIHNLLNELYIQDAVDNSPYNAYKIDKKIVNPHSPDAAEVYLGLPIHFHAGVKIYFGKELSK